MTSLGVQALPRTSTEGTISEPVGCYTNMADWTTDERLMLERLFLSWAKLIISHQEVKPRHMEERSKLESGHPE